MKKYIPVHLTYQKISFKMDFIFQNLNLTRYPVQIHNEEFLKMHYVFNSLSS